MCYGLNARQQTSRTPARRRTVPLVPAWATRRSCRRSRGKGTQGTVVSGPTACALWLRHELTLATLRALHCRVRSHSPKLVANHDLQPPQSRATSPPRRPSPQRHGVQCSSIAPCLARGKQFFGLIDAKCPFVRRLEPRCRPGRHRRSTASAVSDPVLPLFDSMRHGANI